MRIGIITFHKALNNGAVLQAYALQTYLINQGHEVEFINYNKRRKFRVQDFVGKGVFKTWFKWQELYSYFRHKNKFGNLLLTGPVKYNSINDLQDNPPDYDVYMAGSDQIWNFGSNENIDYPYFLNFGSLNLTRIAFAASLGQGIVPAAHHEELRSLLLKFDHLSIREKNGYEFIQELLGDKKNISQIADPTVLLNSVEYLSLVSSREVTEKEYITSYLLTHSGFLEKNQINSINYIKTYFGIDIINIRNPNTCVRLKGSKNIIVHPEKWLELMANSTFNICCSFHAVVFSLIFHKPFIVITQYKNARISSLLSSLNLEYRIVTDFNKKELDSILITPLDWSLVDIYLKKERIKSENYLKKANL